MPVLSRARVVIFLIAISVVVEPLSQVLSGSDAGGIATVWERELSSTVVDNPSLLKVPRSFWAYVDVVAWRTTEHASLGVGT